MPKIIYDRETREAANKRGLGLFGYGYDTKAGVGVAGCPMEAEKAHKLFLFCTLIYKGKKPEQAFKEAYQPKKARIAE